MIVNNLALSYMRNLAEIETLQPEVESAINGTACRHMGVVRGRCRREGQ